MSNYLQKLHTQEKINTAIGAVQIAQNAAMSNKLAKLHEAQNASNEILKKIGEINLYIAEEQRKQTEISTQSLSEQIKQTELQKTQVKLSQYQIQLGIHEKEEEQANKEKLSNMMEVVFHAPKELEAIKSSKKHKIEKYFEFQTLKMNCLMAGVATDRIDDFESKKYISEFFEQLTECIDETLKLDDEEEKDLIDILSILSVDEENLIKKEKNELKKLDKQIEDINKELKKNRAIIKANEKRKQQLLDKAEARKEIVKAARAKLD